MYLDFTGSRIQVEVINESSSLSKHTGASLRRLEVRTVIRGQRRNEEFLSLIDSAKTEGVTSVDEHGIVIGKWKVGNTSWNYTQGTPIYYHTLEIEEIEELELDHLLLGGLKVEPYSYEERFDQDTLTIDAKVLLSEAQYAELKPMLESGDYFRVVRHGISEQPVEMRFGLCYWSKHKEGVKHLLMLVSREFDETPSAVGAAFRWMRPMRNQVAENKGSIDALLGILTDKGILTTGELEMVRADAVERHWDTRHEFFRVEDIDNL